jgi:hypothetical protein
VLLLKGRLRAATWFWMGCAALAACSSLACEGEGSEHPLAAPLEKVCIDEDGDGYGIGCDLGPDCDDHDPAHHDDCAAPRDESEATCEEGEEEDCKVILGTHNGVTDCFVGVRTCIDGAWSNCGDGS